MTERKALIFDFDGLIVDTEAAEMLAWKKEFARHGLDFDMAKYINTIGSNGPEARYEADLLAACPDETRSHDQIWADHTRHSIEEGLKLPPLPGVLELIDQAKAMGLLLAIGSSSGDFWIETLAKGLGIYDCFDTVVTFDQVRLAKPAPDIYLKVLENLKVSPKNALVLEDSYNGVLAANRAGIRVVAVPTILTRHLDFKLAEEVLASLLELKLEKYF